MTHVHFFKKNRIFQIWRGDCYSFLHSLRRMPPLPTGLPVRRTGEYRILYDCHGSEVNPIGSCQFLQRDYLHHHKLLTPAIEEK